MQLDADLIALQEVRTKVERAWRAFETYRSFSQEQVDAVVERAGAAAREHAGRLARLAVEETGMGRAEDKRVKNLLASELLLRSLRGMKTVGVLRDDSQKGIVEMAAPMGVVAAILPTTNPTSTAMFKALIALKAGNAIVLSPHPRAVRCTCETAAVLAAAATEAGAPEGLVECLGHITLGAVSELMKHKRTAVILSTGGSGMVRAAYSSGKPAFGVGPGNVPVLIDKSADLASAIAGVVAGKSFDWGTVCSSEQTVVAERELRERIRSELAAKGAHLCSREEQEALTKVLLVAPNWAVNPECVGQSPQAIARMAGFNVAEGKVVLVTEIAGIGKDHALSAEKLSPVLSLHFVDGWTAALDACENILRFGGLGHTCAIYAADHARIREYAARMPAMRVLANTPAPQGSTGITTNLFPAMTLGCGAVAGNSTGDNIGPLHLINTKRLAYGVRDAGAVFEGVPGDREPSPASTSKFQGASDVVDRFIGSRRTPRKTNPPPACPAPAPAATPPAPQPAATVDIMPFVSESDVRQAMHRGRKIYIGPKSILTPSARELGNQHDVFVMAERK